MKRVPEVVFVTLIFRLSIGLKDIMASGKSKRSVPIVKTATLSSSFDVNLIRKTIRPVIPQVIFDRSVAGITDQTLAE